MLGIVVEIILTQELNMWLQTFCSLEFDAPVETPFILMLRPRSGAQQWVAQEQYVLLSSVPAIDITDQFGNLRSFSRRLSRLKRTMLVPSDSCFFVRDKLQAKRTLLIRQFSRARSLRTNLNSLDVCRRAVMVCKAQYTIKPSRGSAS